MSFSNLAQAGQQVSYQVRVNANGLAESAVAHRPPSPGFPLPAFAGTGFGGQAPRE